MKAPRNTWYAAGWPSDFTAAPTQRTILEEPLVFFRTSVGKLVALHNICTHRFGNNCWVFVTRGIEHVIRRAEKNGATIVMEPYPPPSQMGMVVGKFRDPAGNQIELLEVGTDKEEKLHLKAAGS